MNIKYIEADLLSTTEVNCIFQSCNAFNTFGSGIAFAIKTKYPEAYIADCETEAGDRGKMGTFTLAHTADGKKIFNLYGQYSMERHIRATDYNALTSALERVRDYINLNDENAIIGIPFLMGCALGGGDWRVVESIIISVFNGTNIPIRICVLPVNMDKYKDYYYSLFQNRDRWITQV